MSSFGLYLQLGIEHITDLKSYDHILFLVTLCASYSFIHWKRVLILVTAFTVGHTTTLALATLGMFSVSNDIVEFLIPVTIFITALINIFYKIGAYSVQLHSFKYFAALFFGLIHGLGFSNYLKSLLSLEEKLSTALFSFNLGVEIGQIFIVLAILTIAMLIVDLLKYSRREWNLILSGAGLGISLIMMLERI
jgi:HupE / UreJ protein